jgi:NAD(P)-dependent dehydrogenase (short-subunit alcohol dehydrogenase family)
MPAKNFSGKKCLITGAASGIGRATALAAGSRGAQLFLTDIDEAALAQVAREVAGAGGTVPYHGPADVADREAVGSMAREIHDAHGGLDVVMNIAGVSTWGRVEEMEHHHWKRMVDVNLMGPIHVIECFVPPMIAAGKGGHLVNVASAAALFGLPWHAAYSASKFGLRGVSEVLRFDLRRHDIGVTLVCPGGVSTPLVGTLEIVGVDRSAPAIQKAVGRFERRAVTPERAAEVIVRGVEKDRYLVFTSRDIRVGHWAQRFFPPAYEAAMRRLNDRLTAVAERARAG